MCLSVSLCACVCVHACVCKGATVVPFYFKDFFFGPGLTELRKNQILVDFINIYDHYAILKISILAQN